MTKMDELKELTANLAKIAYDTNVDPKIADDINDTGDRLVREMQVDILMNEPIHGDGWGEKEFQSTICTAATKICDFKIAELVGKCGTDMVADVLNVMYTAFLIGRMVKED